MEISNLSYLSQNVSFILLVQSISLQIVRYSLPGIVALKLTNDPKFLLLIKYLFDDFFLYSFLKTIKAWVFHCTVLLNLAQKALRESAHLPDLPIP